MNSYRFFCRSKLTDELLKGTTFKNKESLMSSWEYWDTCTAVSRGIVDKLTRNKYTIETPEHGVVEINGATELSRYQDVVKGGPTRVLLVTTTWKKDNGEMFKLNPEMRTIDICVQFFKHFKSLDDVSCFLSMLPVYTIHCGVAANVICFDVFLRATRLVWQYCVS